MLRLTCFNSARDIPGPMPSVCRGLLRIAVIYTFFMPSSHATSVVIHGQQSPYLLEAAGFMLTFIIAALLIGVLLGLPSLVRRLFPSMPWPNLPMAQQPDKGTEWEELSMRRETLDERLQIDAPRICSARGIPCTCWSFCGSDPDHGQKSNALPLSETMCAHSDQTKHEMTAIPIVDRSNVTDCPIP